MSDVEVVVSDGRGSVESGLRVKVEVVSRVDCG